MKVSPSLFFVAFLGFFPPVPHAAAETTETFSPVEWTAEELKQDIAVRRLRDNGESSTHAIRLRTAETPHVHDKHDVSVLMIKGSAKVHVGEKVEAMRPGSRLLIPPGTVHWAENIGPETCEVYAIFTPPYDGKDYREIKIH